MGLILKQSTAVDVIVGPFIDDTDGKTAETALTITQAEVRLSKNGGNMAQKNEATALVHDELGYYDCNLDATDTNTLGRLQLMIHEAGALPVYHEYMVVTANEYDSMCSTDYKQVDLIQMGGVTQSGTDLKDFADTGYDPATHKVAGVVLADTTTTNTDLTAFAANYTAARAGYLDELAAANLPTDVAAVKTDTAAILTDTNELQTDWVNGGRLDLIVDAILADSNELQTDWTNGGRLDLLLDATKEAVDTEVAAIKAITDTLVLADIADAVLDEVVDTNAPANCNSLRETINVIASAVAGKCSGVDTDTPTFRDLGDTKDRLVTAIDANDNRTASTPDGT